jgi:hypothetical protein
MLLVQDGQPCRQIPLLWPDEALAVRASPVANAGRAPQMEGFRCACGAETSWEVLVIKEFGTIVSNWMDNCPTSW